MNFDSYGLQPGGDYELEGFDPGYQTTPTLQDADPLGVMQHPVASGETVRFEALLMLAGNAGGSTTLRVSTPANPNGGFFHQGADAGGDFQNESYGADDFNTAVGELRTGTGGTLDGWDAHYVSGMLRNGNTPGVLKVLPTNLNTLKSGSNLKVYVIAGAGPNEVGA